MGTWTRLKRNVSVSAPATPAEIAPGLWADPEGPEPSAALLQQYSIYVEMADRISARRMLTNTFFLTLNSAALPAMSALWITATAGRTGWLAFPLVGLLFQCTAWFWMLRSYRQLNSAKYAVIGALEERLPSSPYWRAEWVALGQGRDPGRYLPITHLEQWIPGLFALVYLTALITLAAA